MSTRERSRDQSTAFWREAAAAGAIGAATIAVWFLALDILRGRPLYTPTVLGTALVRGPGLASPETLPVSPGMVVLFTLAHGAVFLAIGAIAAGLIRLAEKNANYGFGLILFFVFVLCGFLFVAMIFAEDILRASPGRPSSEATSSPWSPWPSTSSPAIRTSGCDRNGPQRDLLVNPLDLRFTKPLPLLQHSA